MVKNSDLIGSWCLISWRTVYDGGRIIFPMGEDAKGYLVYSNDGFMSASLFLSKRPHFISGEMLTADDSDKIKAWNSYFSYSGKFKIEGDQVHHYVLSSMYPNWVGDTQTRVVSIVDKELILETLPQKTKKGIQRSIVKWVKTKID
tara:strand:+ start:99 stop:536 length:438 start_codon:yes stop_codon:yes gene_type:complete